MNNNNYHLPSPSLLFSLLFSYVSFPLFSQTIPNGAGKEVKETSRIVPLDVQDIMLTLQDAPKEGSAKAKSKPLTLALPMPDGQERQFVVEQNDVVSGEFAAAFPELKTYSMRAADDPAVAGRLTVSPFGVRSSVFAKEGWIEIAPVDYQNPVLHKVQLSSGEAEGFHCGVTGGVVSQGAESMMMPTTPWSNGATLKKYRFAIVTTYYYYELHGSSVGAAQAAVAAVVNDLSALYERELAVRFILNQPPYIYSSAAQSSLDFNPAIDRTQLAANAVAKHFQANAYDIGHAFHGGTYLTSSTWNGGVATTNGLCNDNKISPSSDGLLKAAGWSSFYNTTVDDNTFRVVAHELGHMFSMPHTWNGDCSNVAAGQGNQIGDAYEIGSGSTILGYRDVCSQFNVPGSPPTYNGIQPSPGKADDYFHNVSLGRALTQIGNFPTCGISSPSGNTPPVMDATPTGCNATYTVPKGTPFKLTGSGTDADGDPVYYCWEQFDEDGPGNPTQAKVGAQAAALALAPLFRSYPPTTDPSRTFPIMTLVAANNYASNFEPLPTVARTMKFRLTGRDFKAGGGGIHYDSVNVTVSNLGPLTVTAPNTAQTIAAGSSTIVTWKGNGINFLTNVRIKMSVDGGLTFPYTLLASTPNDESQSVTIPTTVPGTTTARIMVESADYTCFSFFDISNTNFTITNAGCTPAAHNLCNVSPVTAAAGNAALNLNSPTVIYGQPITSIPVTPSGSSSMAFNAAAPAGPGTCHNAGGWMAAYDTKPFMVGTSGNYKITNASDFAFRIISIYSSSYSAGTPCTNYIGSNAFIQGGGAGNAGDVTFNLTACTQYVMVVWDPNNIGAVTIPISGPGPVYLTATTPPAGYTQTYLAVNTATNNIAAASATANFTSLAQGSYLVYGAHYINSANPASWVGQSLSQALAANCVAFSNNSKPLTVQPGASTPPSLAISGSPSVNEGNSVNSTFTFTVARTGNLAAQSTASWAVTGSGSNAANATDFPSGAFPSGTVTFPAGSASQAITVTVQADATDEQNEGFTVTLSNPANATIGTATATGTILDDDPLTSACSGSYGAAAHTGGTCAAADQGIGVVTFAGINQNSPCSASLPAGYTDYTGSGGATVSKGCPYSLQVLIGNMKPGDQVHAYFDWNADGDFSDAGEDITLTGSGNIFSKNVTVPGNAAMGSTRMRVRLFAVGVTPAPTGSVVKGEAEDYCVSIGATGVSISSSAATKDEGNSGTTAFTFSVSRSCPSTVATTLNWQVSGSGTNPAAAADFPNSLFPSGSITFPAGSTAAQTITVNVNGDTNGEPDEQFTVSLSPQDNASIDIGSANGTIKNDDSINVWITGSPSQNEGNSGTTAFTFTINRNLFNGTATTVNWAVTGSGANPASASDFNNSTFPSGTVTFPASSGLSQTITVNVKGDTGVEQNEGFTVTLSSPTNGNITTATASGTILNDDAGTPPTIAISGSPSLNEGNAGSTAFNFTVTRTGSITNASSASWAVTGSGTNAANATDFAGVTLPSGTVTFPASSSAAQTITVNVNGDATFEPDENFTVTLTNPTNATITTATAGGTILGDDGYCAAGANQTFENISDVVFNTINNHSTALTGYQNFTSISTTVTQGATYAFIGTIAGGLNDEEIIVWIDYNQDFDFADPGEEVYNSPVGSSPFSSNITIPGGAMTGTTRMRVRLNDNGNPPLNGTPCGNSQIGQVEDYTINIIASVPSLAISGSPSLTEGNSGSKFFNFTVTRTGNLTNASSLTATVTGSGGNPAVAADFTGGVFLNGTVNFPAGSTTQTVSVSVNGDLTVESNEGFTVTLSSPTNATITTATASGTIQNDDVAGIPDIAIQAGPSINEGNTGSTAFNFTVVRTGSTTNQTTVQWNAVPVNVAQTANAGDFAGGAFPSGTVTFPAGSGANQTITVNVAGDTEIEVAELFNVDLSNPVNGNITTASNTASINNDDTPGSGCLGAYIQTAVLQGCQTSGQFISNVSFNTINNSSTCANSGNAGYTNYTGISTSVNRSASYPITVTHGGSNTGIAEVTVWFDWNADADFADAGEEFELTLGTFPNWTGNIAVPVGAVLGSTRMRVRMAGYATPVATGFQDAAEAEDYCITILAACTPPTVNAPTVTQPTCSVATGSIVVNTGAGTFDYSINNGTTWQASATFSNLPPGNYNIKVRLQASPICTTAYASNPVVLAAAAGCGTALEFNPGAPTDYVACGNILTSCYTKEVWVNVVAASGVENNFISGGAAALHAFWAPVAEGYRVSAGHNGTWDYVQDPNPIPTGWQHFAVTYNSTTQVMQLFKNGVLVDEAFNVPAATGTNMVRIGAFDTFGFDGLIDEVRIWNYARNESDILADKDVKLTGKEPGLVAYYDFEQGAPNGSNAGLTTLYDKALPANNGTLTNFALTGSTSNWTQPGAPVTSDGTTATSFYSVDLPITISAAGTPTVTSTLEFPNAGTITDLEVVNLDIDHTYIDDLRVKLKSPSGTERILLNRICDGEDNILLDFDDESANTYASIPCPPNGGNYQPNQTLAAFDGENAKGTWTLTIEDLFPGDGGTLQNWGLSIDYTSCATPVITAPTVTQTSCTVSTGTIVVNAACSGTLEYSVNNGATWQASATFANLPPGAYNIKVRLADSKFCEAAYGSNPALIEAVPAPPTINEVMPTQATCTTPTGTIVVDAIGIELPSTPPSALEYSKDNGANWQTSNTFSGLAAGSYTLKVRLQASPACSTTYAANPVVLVAAANCTPAKSLDFDGTNDYVALPANLTASLTNFTFEAWVYWDGANDWQQIFDFGNTTTVYMQLTPSSGSNSSKPTFAINNGGGEQVINSSVSATLNQWQHYAVVLDDAANTGVLYLDGVQVGSNTAITITPAAMGNLANNWLGRSQFGGDPYFNGKMDDVRIWSIAKTSQQVQCEMDETLVGNEPGLVANYHFDQGFADGGNSGLDALDDLSANGNDGTLLNFALDGAGSNWAAASGSGKVLDFATDDYVPGTNASLPVGNTARTIECWVKSSPASSGLEMMYNYGTSANSQRASLMFNSNGTLLYAGFANDLAGTTNIRDGIWHHCAATFDGTTLKVYVDGNLEASAAKTFATIGTNFAIGRRVDGASEFLDGKLDELRVWNFAKTQDQIRAQKNVQLSGAETGLVAYYPFNQGIAGGTNTGLTTLEDRSPTNADGTLNGFALTGSTSNWAGPSALSDAPGLGCCPTTLYVNGIITSGTYHATTEVYSNGIIPNGATVVFQGASGIFLQPDFQVILGGIYSVLMQACTP